MRILKDKEEQEAKKYIEEAIKIAKKSTCQRSKCGSIIVKDNKIIGEGFNSPPNNQESQRRCTNEKEKYHQKAGKPYCTICSKLALETGIKEFIL